MKPFKSIPIVILFFILLTGCAGSSNEKSQAANRNTLLCPVGQYMETSTVDLIGSVQPVTDSGLVRTVIEIPAGTREKWEVKKDGKTAVWDFKNGKPRIIQYIGYPGNYGFIPRSSMPKESGGDGDPLDVIVLGDPVPRGTILETRLIGVLQFLDNGEKDDKLIAVHVTNPADTFSNINDIDQLKQSFPGVLEILKIWFQNYKSAGEMQFKGTGTAVDAKSVLDAALKAYERQNVYSLEH